MWRIIIWIEIDREELFIGFLNLDSNITNVYASVVTLFILGYFLLEKFGLLEHGFSVL